MSVTTDTPTVSPDQFNMAVSELADALDPETVSDLRRRDAIAEIVHTVTDHEVKAAEAELAGAADMDVWFDEHGILVHHDGIALWERDAVEASTLDPDAIIPVDHENGDVVIVDTDFIYRTVDLSLGGEPQ